MKQSNHTVAKFALRVFAALCTFCIALEILGFVILFCLLGFFAEIARPVFILSAFLFIIGSLLMMVASVWIAVEPAAPEIAGEKKPTTPTRIDRLVSGFIGSLGGCIVGLISFLLIWGSYGRLDFAFVAFHAVLLAFMFFAYTWPNVVPEISLSVVDSVAQSIASIF